MGETINKKGAVVTFGEILMRLSPSENRKFQQANNLHFFFGGTEFNVAASLSNFGLATKHVSNVSNDFVGEAALAFVRQFGVDASAINKVEYPLGLYFIEVGASIRPSQVAYNRLNAAFAYMSPAQVDWEHVLKDTAYFHWTGITPGISSGVYETLKKGLKIAKTKNITVTTDPTYRSNLWKYGREGQEILQELIGLSTIFIGGVNEINEVLKSDFEYSKTGFIEASKKLIETYPSIERIFDKVRVGVSASQQKIYGQAWTGEQYITTDELQIANVVDRIGTGDAYAAGVLYGLQQYNNQKTLEFATAACALKHTVLGDINRVNVSQVLEVVRGNIDGRIKR